MYLVFINKKSWDKFLVNINSKVIKSWKEFFKNQVLIYLLANTLNNCFTQSKSCTKERIPLVVHDRLSSWSIGRHRTVLIKLYYLSYLKDWQPPRRLASHKKTYKYYCVLLEANVLQVGVIAPVISWFGVTQENWYCDGDDARREVSIARDSTVGSSPLQWESENWTWRRLLPGSTTGAPRCWTAWGRRRGSWRESGS